MCNNMYFVYQIKKILNKAEEIGQKIGKGLTRVRHRSDYLNNSKSLPTEQMPNWWISSGWLLPEMSDDDNEGENDLINDNKNDPRPPSPPPPPPPPSAPSAIAT